MKQCIKCNLYFPHSSFRRNKRQKDGLEYYCRKCSSNLHKIYDHKRDATTIRQLSLKRNQLHREYGLTLPQYQEMLNDQHFLCAICKKGENDVDRSFAVDHDHKTGKVRGLLCNSCNAGLGYFKDSPEILKSAISYLEVTCHLVKY